MIDPLYIYEVVDEEGRVVAGPYRAMIDAEKAVQSLCYQTISVNANTTEEQILAEFDLAKFRIDRERIRYSIKKTEVI